MTSQVASILAALISAMVGILGWQLSARAQRSSQQRQKVIDQGPYVESLQGWSKEIVAWYKEQMAVIERSHREEVRQTRMDCDERLRQVQARTDYWKRRALGENVSDHTPPDDL
jgi:hypothetical protein